MFEPDEVRWMKRQIALVLYKAGDQDPEGLKELRDLLQEAIDVGVPEVAAEQRKRYGWSWLKYQKAFGYKSRQSAQNVLDPKLRARQHGHRETWDERGKSLFARDEVAA